MLAPSHAASSSSHACQVSQLEARISEAATKLAATQSESDKWRAALDGMEQRLLEIERMDDETVGTAERGSNGAESSAGTAAVSIGQAVTLESSGGGDGDKQEGQAGAREVVSGAGSEGASELRVQERVGAVRQRLQAAQAGRELVERELAAVRAEREAAVKAGADVEAKVSE